MGETRESTRAASPVTRRLLLAALGGGAAAALLAACGGGAAPTATTAPKAAEPTKPAAPAATTAPTAAAKPAEPTKPAAATTAPAAGATAAPTTAAAATKPAAAATTAPATKPGLQADMITRITGPFDGEAQTLNGAGATFPAALYSKWFNDYFNLTKVKVNYQSIGSGGGIKTIQDMTADFGATDGPMTDEQLKAAKGGPIFHVPMALGAVVPTYNIPEMQGKLIKFTPETLPAIYLGTITKWNDPKLVADNPDLAAINKDIVVVRRSDGSGTTFIWVDYLASVSPEWKSKVGVATSVNWPVGIGGKGNEGVAGEVKQNPYSLGYVELIYAVQNKLGVGYVKNLAGNFAEPKIETVTAAAAGAAAEGKIPPDLRASIVNAPGPNAYPISGFTWLLAYEQMKELPKAIALTRLMWWCMSDGQKATGELGYAPLPEAVVALGQGMVKKITVDGKPAFPGK
jgi:phosphate transport system substrate-binding protein